MNPKENPLSHGYRVDSHFSQLIKEEKKWNKKKMLGMLIILIILILILLK